jgi:hypothetical protein
LRGNETKRRKRIPSLKFSREENIHILEEISLRVTIVKKGIKNWSTLEYHELQFDQNAKCPHGGPLMIRTQAHEQNPWTGTLKTEYCSQKEKFRVTLRQSHLFLGT